MLKRFVKRIVILLGLLIVFDGGDARAGEFGVFCETVEEQIREAERAIDLGSFVSAERSLNEIRSEHPRCERTLLGLGRIAAARGRVGDALNRLRQYKDAKPTDPEGYFYLTQLLLEQKNYPRADVMSELAVVFGPDHPGALMLRGKILAMKGQPDQAEQMFSRAAELDRDNPEIFYDLGVLRDSRKKSAEAVEAFQKAVELDPGNPSAWDYLALNLEPLGEIERANEAYRRGLAVNDSSRFDRFLDYNYGRFLMKQNRLEEAKKHLDRAVQLAPNTRAVHYEHGKLMLALGRPEVAARDLERAAEIPDPGDFVLDIQVYYLLSQAYARLGKGELARKYAEMSRQADVPIQGRSRQ